MRGSRPGERRGGRKRGTKNRLTLLRESARAEAEVKIVATLGPNAFDGDAHTLLMLIYRDQSLPIELRVDAAKAALGFEKPRLASIQSKIDGSISLSAIVEKAMIAIEGRVIDGEPLRAIEHGDQNSDD